MLSRPLLGPVSRCFSSSACASKHVSHIGRTPIKFPPTVTLTPTPTALNITGPLGTTSVHLHPFVKLANPKPDTLAVTVEDPEIKVQRQMWGTTRTLIANAVQGMTEGFSKPVYLVGVGFRAALEEDPRAASTATGAKAQRINMKVGHSHNIVVPIPPHIKVEVPNPTKILLSCTDKHELGLFAAKIREYRKPEPYKGKGIFVGDEKIRIKSVKKK